MNKTHTEILRWLCAGFNAIAPHDRVYNYHCAERRIDKAVRELEHAGIVEVFESKHPGMRRVRLACLRPASFSIVPATK